MAESQFIFTLFHLDTETIDYEYNGLHAFTTSESTWVDTAFSPIFTVKSPPCPSLYLAIVSGNLLELVFVENK